MHEDGAFSFIQAVFHVILFIVVHCNRSGRGIKTTRKQPATQKRDLALPPTLRSAPRSEHYRFRYPHLKL